MGENEVLKQSVVIDTDDAVDSLENLAEGFEKAADSSDKLGTSADRIQSFAQKVQTALESNLTRTIKIGNGLSDTSRKMQAAVQQAQYAEEKLARKIDEAGRAYLTQNQKVQEAQKGYNDLQYSINAIVAALGEETEMPINDYLKLVKERAKEATKALKDFTYMNEDTGQIELRPNLGMFTDQNENKAYYHTPEDFTNAIPVDKVTEYMAAIEKAQTLEEELSETTRNLTTAQEKAFETGGVRALNELLEKAATNTERQVAQADKLGMSYEYLQADMAHLQSQNDIKLAGISETDTKSSLSRTKKHYKSFFDAIERMAKKCGNAIKKVVTGNGLVSKLVSKMADRVAYSLQRVSYIAKRMLTRMALTAFFNATGEGLKNLANDSEGFNSVMSNMIGRFKQFTNQLAAVFAPIITAAEPIVERFQNMLQSLAEKVAEFIARLTGQDHYEVALPVEYDFAEGKEKEAEATDDVTDATKKATKARKEYNATVLGFDQLNKLDGGPGDSDTDTSSTKSNTNTKKKEEDTKQRFKRVELDGKSAVQQFADQIRNLFDTSGFESGFMGLSEWLGNKASELVHVFADGLNGHTIGHVVATAINGLLMFIREMFKNPDDWKKIGEELGVALTDAITGIDSDLASDAINNLVLSLLELLTGFITGANWEDIGVKVGEILSKIKWVEILSKTFKLLGQAFSELITMLGAIIGTLLGNLIKKLVDNFKQRMKDSGGNLAYAFVEGVIDIFDWFGEHIIKPFLEGISSILGDFSSVVPNWKPIKVPEFSMDTMYKASKETGDSKSSNLATGLTTMMLPPGRKEASLLSTLFSSGKNNNNKANFEDSVERGTEKAMSKYMNQNSETTILLDGEQVGTLLDKANRRRNTRINPKLAMG